MKQVSHVKDGLVRGILTCIELGSYFLEGNTCSVSFPERDSKSERGWGFDILCIKGPGARRICANAPRAIRRTDALRCQSPVFFVQARWSTTSKETRLTMSVPKSIQRMVIMPKGWGIPIIMNIKNGVISGMLLVSV